MNLKARILNNLSEWRIDRNGDVTNIKNFENLFGNEVPFVLFSASEVDKTKSYLTKKDKKEIKKAMISAYYSDYWKLAFGERASFKSGFTEEEWKEITETSNVQNYPGKSTPNGGLSNGKIFFMIGLLMVLGLSIALFIKKISAKTGKRK